MRRFALGLYLCALLVACGGCGKDYFPQRLLVHDATPGKVNLAVKGSPEQLLKDFKIDMHRRFRMADDVEIDTWVIKARPPKSPDGQAPAAAGATVVILHGLTESKGQYLDLGRRLAADGYDVVLLDLRAHGHSTGKYVTYGAWERVDVKTVVDELIADKAINPRIYVFGVSLGASTAIQYAAIDPKKVRGVVAVAPFKDAYSICRQYLPWMSKESFEKALRRAGDPDLGNFNPEDASALKAVAVLVCPILLIHGRLDTTVPHEHSKALFEAGNEPKKLITLDWAGHATMFLGREKWFADQIEDLDRVARNYEKKLGVGATTGPATEPSEPKAPGLKPTTPTAPVPRLPEEEPATRPAPMTQPATEPATQPAAPPTTQPAIVPPIEVGPEPSPATRQAPATQPATKPAPDVVGVPPPPIDIGVEPFPRKEAPATQPATKPAPDVVGVPPPPIDIGLEPFPRKEAPTTRPSTQPAAPPPSTLPSIKLWP